MKFMAIGSLVIIFVFLTKERTLHLLISSWTTLYIFNWFCWNFNFLYGIKASCPCMKLNGTRAPCHEICIFHMLGLKIHHT